MAPFQAEMRAICPTPLSPQICLLTTGASLSQDLAMDRIPSPPMCTHRHHGGNFIFFCKTEVENLLKLCC